MSLKLSTKYFAATVVLIVVSKCIAVLTPHFGQVLECDGNCRWNTVIIVICLFFAWMTFMAGLFSFSDEANRD